MLRNALADLDDEDGELPLGQATPRQLEEPLEELGKVGCQLGPSSPAGNFTLGGVSALVIDEVGADFLPACSLVNTVQGSIEWYIPGN